MYQFRWPFFLSFVPDPVEKNAVRRKNQTWPGPRHDVPNTGRCYSKSLPGRPHVCPGAFVPVSAQFFNKIKPNWVRLTKYLLTESYQATRQNNWLWQERRTSCFRHFAHTRVVFLDTLPPTESHVIMLSAMTSEQTGKKFQDIFARLSNVGHRLQKHGPGYDPRFYNRDVPNFGHHFSYKRYGFSKVSPREIISIL